ncbi:hypothetical protein [Streptomyces sp. NBC_00102]|uniref:hypothetical protein n=1 Tax=Streptomyces sp. NBC_00102 TaxID=2975652 RepID=UPI0022583F01|nr:hypothetical protein [Streptomyces sp. NBC_00102]MCX5401211.1 hypothetical protein [Streptomyces sp. NBC_00102]
MGRKGLPEVWVGDTGILASDAVNAAGRAVTRMSEAFHDGARALLTPADAIGAARERMNDATIGRATGSDYQRQDLDSATEHRAVLTEVENSVAQGRPVPVDVSGEEGAHAMTIIAQEGDMLQVCNPWGNTTWVSEDDFVNGHMGKASNSDLSDTYSVHRPR